MTIGAEEFCTSGTGETVQEAFHEARERAFYDVGHEGYSGTIAEKNSYKLIPCEMTHDAVDALVDKCLEDMDHWCQDKWGPAAAIQVLSSKWVFFGWASS